MNKIIKHLTLGIFALVLVLGTLFLQMESKNKDDLKKVEFGYPFQFMTQDLSANYSFSYFPTWAVSTIATSRW
jgi:hypothetical protein